MTTYILILIIVILFLVYDFFPVLRPIIERNFKNKKSNSKETSMDDIINASFEMISTNRVSQFWTKKGNPSFTRMLLKIIRDRGVQRFDEFKIFNYPKGFLILGLVTYFKKVGDNTRLNILKGKFDELYLDNNGQPLFIINRVDQSPFATASLMFYNIYKEEKYRNFADLMYKYIVSMEDEDTGIIKYRKSSNTYFNDTLGMIIPFLVKYYEITQDVRVLNICKNQIDFYNNYGLDEYSHLPVHGINMSYNNLKVGSANWGRGVGWYFYGLSSLNKITNSYSKEIQALENTLNTLKTHDGLWTQFPGSSNKYDASTTTMILASLTLFDMTKYNKADIFKSLSKYIDNKGYVLETSGDTLGLNVYSRDFGTSELSQGFLLLTLANLKD